MLLIQELFAHISIGLKANLMGKNRIKHCFLRLEFNLPPKIIVTTQAGRCRRRHYPGVQVDGGLDVVWTSSVVSKSAAVARRGHNGCGE